MEGWERRNVPPGKQLRRAMVPIRRRMLFPSFFHLKSSVWYHIRRVVSRGEFGEECPSAQLKEIKERKGNLSPRVTGTEAIFLEAKAVVGTDKNSKDSLEIFQLSGKAPATPCQRGDIMAQISVDTLHCEGIVFVVDVEDVLTRKNDIQITEISVRTVLFCLRSCIHHFLNGCRRFIQAHNMSQDLTGFPTHHRHDIDIFPRFCPGLNLQKPVQFIQLYDFGFFCTCFALFNRLFRALFLSNSSHWICSYAGFSPRSVR